MRKILGIAAFVLVAALLIWEISTFSSNAGMKIPIDFAACYSVGALTLAGENPYDAKQLLEIQRNLGLHHDHAIQEYHPPWLLGPMAVTALLPAQTSFALYDLVVLILLLLCGDRLWVLYGGRAELRWIGWLIALTFAPSIALLGSAQKAGFSLAGLTLFLYAARNNRPMLAGIAAALVAVKPHLNLLFGMMLFLETFTSRFARRAVASGIAVGVVMSVLPMALDRHVWHDFVESVTAPGDGTKLGLADWKPPLVSSFLRLGVNDLLRSEETPQAKRMWIQALPCLMTACVFPVMWFLRRRDWNWLDFLPPAILISLFTAPYGAWIFDLTLLLVPVTAMAARASPDDSPRRRIIVLTYLLIVDVVVSVLILAHVGQDSYFWVTPLTAIAWLLCRSRSEPQ